MLHWLLSTIILLATFAAPHSAFAAPTTIDTSISVAATENSSQRKTFFDSENEIHWAFYYNGAAIEYSYSADGESWTSAGTLPYNTASFSVVYKNIAGTSYVFVAAEANTHDLVMRRGTLGTTTITFDAEITIFDGSGNDDSYSKPTTIISENNHLWLSAIKDHGADKVERFHVAVRRSTNLANGNLAAFNAETSVGRRIHTLESAVLVPRNGDSIYLVASADDGNITGYTFDGTQWSTANTSGDYSWFGFGSGEFGSYVYAMAISGSDIYLGGDFMHGAGIVAARSIVKWDGTKWSALNEGLDGYVESIAVSGTDIFVGGEFTDAGGIAGADNIARWDGSSWHALGNGVNDIVYAIATSGTDVVVGGNFIDAGGIAEADYIARWDGNSWNALGTSLNNGVSSILISGGDIFVGGGFTDAGGIAEADSIARWDGSNWHALGTGLSDAPTTMAISGNDLYVGGWFTDAGGIAAADMIARWDGNNWNALGSGLSDGVEAIVISGSNVYVGGYFNNAGGNASADRIARWDGASWNAVGTGQSNTVYSLMFAGGLLYAGFESTVFPVSIWDGSSWSNASQNGGINGTVYTVAISNTDLYIGGTFVDAGGVAEADYIARWDGNYWHGLGAGLNGTVQDIAVSAGNLYVGGSFTDAGGVAAADKIAIWNGTTWSALGSGISNGGVNDIEITGSDVYVGGSFTDAGGNGSADRIARWNGTTWNALGSGVGNTVQAIAISGSNIYVGGSFVDAGGNASADRIARWNGTSWNALGSGLTGTVYSIAILGSDVYVGGFFGNAGGIAEADNIARWDGTNWNAMANGLTHRVSAITINGSDIYVGGIFDGILAKWDGSSWQSFGGLTNYLEAITFAGDAMYIGGSTFGADGIALASPIAYYAPTIAADADTTTELSATSDSDGNIYLSYTNENDEIKFRRYDNTDAEWQPTVTLNATASSSPSLTYKNSDGRVTASWIESSSLNYRHALTPYQAADWKAEATHYSTGTNASATTVANQETNDLMVAWTNGAANPYTIYADPIDMSSLPTVTISTAAGSATNSSPIPVTFQFNKTVTGFVVGDITVGNGSAGNFVAVDGDTYTADITPTAEGNVTVNVAAAVAKDLFNNDNTIATQLSVSYDTTAPTVVISSTATSPTNTSPIPVTFQFSQAVTGFVIGDITIGNGTAGSFVAVDGDTYTADITPTAQGAVTVDVAANKCADAAGNDNTAATQFTITYDSVAPSVVISSTATSPTNTSPIPVTFQFSQAVTGFVIGDITVGNGTAGSFVAVDGDTYTADITPTAQGAVTVDVAASKCADAAGNDNSAATQFTITYDSVAPSVVISSSATSPTDTSPIPLTFEFSETVTGFTISDISVDNAIKSNFIAVDGDTYIARISPTNSGEITVNIATAAATDASGNPSTAATQFSILYEANDTDTDGDEVIDTQEAIDETNPLDSGSFLALLPTSWCSDWNGFFGMYNVNEYTNLSDESRHIVAITHDKEGTAQSATGFSIEQDQQIDLLVHALQGWQSNSYGEVCSEVTNGEKGDVDGRMVYYKPNSIGYDFAFALPYQAGLRGNQFVTFNTMQPSLDPADSENKIANWVQLTNLEESEQRGSLIFYGFDGEVLTSEAVTLSSRARRDFAAHLLGRGIIGTVEWRPQTSTAKFVLRNTRYYYDNSEMIDSFDGALQLEGMKGNGEMLSALVDTRGQMAVLEIANTTASDIAATVSFYSSSGELATTQRIELPAHGSQHLVANGTLNNELGLATIKGSAIGSVIATAMHYGQASDLSLTHSYATPAKQALGTTLHSSYNTYLGQSCELQIANASSSSVTTTLNMKRLDNTPVITDQELETPAKGTTIFDLCNQEDPNHYGTVTLDTDKNSTVATILRSSANGDYRFVTPVR